MIVIILSDIVTIAANKYMDYLYQISNIINNYNMSYYTYLAKYIVI